MRRNFKIIHKNKIELAKEYLEGSISFHCATINLEVTPSAINEWTYKYKIYGIELLLNKLFKR